MNFKIEFSSKAYKYLNKLDSVTKTRILYIIENNIPLIYNVKIGPRGDVYGEVT